MRKLSLQEYYNHGLGDAAPDTIVSCKVVAVIGYGHDWTAYYGPSDWTDEKVAERGDKVPRDAAENLFPTFKNIGLWYRS